LAALLGVGNVARAKINLEWRPAAQVVNLNDTVNIGLYAVSDNSGDQSMSAMDVILDWDTTYLDLTGVVNNGPYTWMFSGFPDDSGLDGLNNSWADGDALYEALSVLGSPASATPMGLLVATLQFEALALTPGTMLDIVPSRGSFTNSRVYDGTVPGLAVQGSMGSAQVTIVPEPASLLVLGAGALAMRRRGSSR
jgi:hypothetical protein